MKHLRALVTAMCVTLFGCSPVPDVQTNVRLYNPLLNDWKPSGLVNHFPSPIPSSATGVRFSAFPGFLQGGGWIQVRMKLPDPAVTNVFEDATRRARQYHDGGDFATLINQRKDGLASANFHTSAANEIEFPTDYRVFIFDAKPYKVGSHFDWNHGQSMGVAVSLQRKEVVYWAENW